MENVSDAIIMAGAVLLFILAFSMEMFMLNRSRTVTDAVYDSIMTSEYNEHVEPNENNVTREVGIETIIPTLYRYVHESIAVEIVDTDGTTILQLFDASVETSMNRKDSNDNIYTNLRGRYDTSGRPAYMFGAPWVTGSSSESNKLKRINAYIYGLDISINGFPVNYSGRGLISYVNSSSNKLFDESYVEYQYSGTSYTDELSGDTLDIVRGEKKTVIRYQKK